MRYKVLHCAGYEQAVFGMMLSYGKTSFDYFTAKDEDIDRVATKLAPMDGGHNKFLEQIQYLILVWWKQSDTYRVGISKSSESTMHKSCHKLKQWRDFCAWIKTELPYGDLITAEKEKDNEG